MPSLLPLLSILLAAGASGTDVMPAAFQSPPPSSAATAAPAPAVAATPVESPRRSEALPLGAGSRSGQGQRIKSSGGAAAMVTVAASLAVVLGLFFFVAWAMRRSSPRGSALLPGEVFEVLGRAPLASRQQVHLLRCGSKLLLVSVTPGGAETLTEVTDAAEVDRMAALCRQKQPQSPTATFRNIFHQFAMRSSDSQRAGHELAGNSDADKAGRRAMHRWEDDDA